MKTFIEELILNGALGRWMSDENIVDLTKRIKEEKSNKGTVGERIINCSVNPNCECMYCTYKDHASKMAYEFIAADMNRFEDKHGAKFSTYDLKDIMYGAIRKVKDIEKKLAEEENDQT